MNTVPLYAGIDDTDSPHGMCTTYVGAVAIQRLQRLGCTLLDFPKLIRLNPCWPQKTRGNCAVAFLVSCPPDQVSEVKEIVLKTVEELAEKDDRTNPGVAFMSKKTPPEDLVTFAYRVVRDIVDLKEAESMANKLGIETHKFRAGNGVIGALAAIGHPLTNDFTYELVAYRTPKNRGKPRKVDPDSVKRMDKLTSPLTFDNLDPWTGEIRITPHTPCPVLYGIRGESPAVLKKAHQLVKTGEPIERVQIFKTNQGTDEHLVSAKIAEVSPLRSYSIEGEIASKPRIIAGGHVIVEICDSTGTIHCAAYEPTRIFRRVVKQLIPGDRVIVHGGVKQKPSLPLTLNLEKIEILELAKKTVKRNPKCPKCGKRMKSEGRGKGYVCKKCKERAPPTAATIEELSREIRVGKFEVPPRARRHLAKPLQRELAVKSIIEF